MTLDHIYLSPHLDDAVFACGGLIRKQRARGERVHVVTVFTASPAPEQLFEFDRQVYSPAQQLDIFAGARAEDGQVMAAIGASFTHLNYNIAMHRVNGTGAPLYPGISKYTGVSKGDVGLTAALEAEFEALRAAHPAATIYIPLGVGSHVDHIQVSLAGRGLSGPLQFYEDFPYVLFGKAGPLAFWWLKRMADVRLWRPFDHPDARAHPIAWPLVFKAFRAAPCRVGGPDHALRQFGKRRWQSVLHPIDLEAKIQSALGYANQIDLLFGTAENAREALALYPRTLSRLNGNRAPYERTWQTA
ncbi:MAG: PIG-L family deacetylase [Anaerolineae bacterium]|nr:PIG-L family deacetylase [Anaerolineae bacterium]